MQMDSVINADLRKVPEQGTVCIFGTGDYGRSLGLRLIQSGYGVVYGSRSPKSSVLLPQGSKVMTHAEAARAAQVIFVTVHREHYGFLGSLVSDLKGKVLVDISNNLRRGMYPESNAEYLSRLVPGANVVKAFNTISAWALQSGGLDANRQVLICGDQSYAKQLVTEIAQSLGFTTLDRGTLKAAAELEDIPLQLLPLWRLPLYIATGLMAFFFIYVLIRDVIYNYVEKGTDNSYRIMVSLANKVFPTVSLVMLALCYLPGALAGFLQLYNGTKYRRFPNWLDRWMLCRKQLGVIALALGFLHVLYTLVKPMRYPDTHSRNMQLINQIKENKTSPLDLQRAWAMESVISLGILGFGLFVLLGITSIPSVGNTMNWREFRFVQSKLGYMTLLLCTAHALLYGWDKFLKPYTWHMPPGYMLAVIIPCVVLVLKMILILPCVDRPLTRIRQGMDRKRKISIDDQVMYTMQDAGTKI